MSKRWYVVHVYSGMEKSVHKAMLERIERADLQHLFGRYLFPQKKSSSQRVVKNQFLSVVFSQAMFWLRWTLRMKVGTSLKTRHA
jgi:transcription antitermination factor NusG